MDRAPTTSKNASTRRPHARGDGPTVTYSEGGKPTQAPRTWGWTVGTVEERAVVEAGPTHVGMDRGLRPADTDEGRRPHARGDGPSASCCRTEDVRAGPTHVGMDRGLRPADTDEGRRPHARGDGPSASCCRTEDVRAGPTHVGMDRAPTPAPEPHPRRPHARG